jgi:hypothetical protein
MLVMSAIDLGWENRLLQVPQLSHPDLRANLNARIHVRQDQVTHMHRLSEYQKHSVKRKESIKQLLHDRMSQLNNRSSS